MSKYDPLTAHLRASDEDQISVTFGEIERVVGARLPASAYRHRAWWSNNPTNSVITDAWLKAGYKTADVDMTGRRLVFRKAGPGGPPAPGDRQDDEATDADMFERIFGALKGTVTVKPGTDLTEPVSTEWDAAQ